MPSAPPVFRRPDQRNRREQRIEQDQRRGSSRERGYTSRWDKAARTFRQSHPLCVGCEADGKVDAAVLVDHVIPHRGDQKLFWDTTNWQSACERCGNSIKQQLERMYDERRITAADLHLGSDVAKRLRAEAGGWSKV